jgi:hypothetical protein
MINYNYKQFVYDVASLWAREEVEVQACKDHLIQEGESYTVDMSLFQWIRFYIESDEKYAIQLKWSSWLKMSCRKGDHKYRLTSKKDRDDPLLVSDLLKEYDRQEILFRRFSHISDDYVPVEQSPRKRIIYSSGCDRTPWKTRVAEREKSPLVYRIFEDVLGASLPKYHPDAGGMC